MSEWQDIATAPGDGTELLLWNGLINIGAWQQRTYARYWATGEGLVLRNVTHWMPLPAPPLCYHPPSAPCQA